MNEPYIQALRDLIRRSYGCISRYAQTIAVKEESGGKVLWEGKVEQFDLSGHAQARQCYAWGSKDDQGRWQYVAYLRLPPVSSAATAVQAHLARQAPQASSPS
jgi:hypothetical protein